MTALPDRNIESESVPRFYRHLCLCCIPVYISLHQALFGRSDVCLFCGPVFLIAYRNFVNHDVIIRANAIANAVTTGSGSFVTPGVILDIGYGIHPGFRGRGKRSTQQGCRLPFLYHVASNSLRVSSQDLGTNGA